MPVRFFVLVAMVLAAAASRLIPHPWNFTPITAMALFGGVHFSQKRWAFLVPLLAMLLSDAVLGFHSGMPVVYGVFALIVCIGLWLRSWPTVLSIAAAALASSILFFLVTNYAVWVSDAMYPRTAEGLWACYCFALPYFGNTLAGDAFYTVALFGSFALAKHWLPMLAEPRLATQASWSD